MSASTLCLSGQCSSVCASARTARIWSLCRAEPESRDRRCSSRPSSSSAWSACTRCWAASMSDGTQGRDSENRQAPLRRSLSSSGTERRSPSTTRVLSMQLCRAIARSTSSNGRPITMRGWKPRSSLTHTCTPSARSDCALQACSSTAARSSFTSTRSAESDKTPSCRCSCRRSLLAWRASIGLFEAICEQ